MIGALFRLGEQKVRPGIFVRWYNAGGYKSYARALGVAAAVIKSNWGPLGKVITVESLEDVKQKLGTGYGADVVKEIFEGEAYFVHTVRAGVGGKSAEIELLNTEGLNVVNLHTKYPTSREFNITLRDSLDSTKKEFLVFEDGRQIESLVFEKENEVNNFVEEVNKTSKYFNAQAQGEGVLEVILNAEVTGGSDPEVTAEDYTNSFQKLETKFFDGITVDVEDPVIHASLHSFVKRKLREGYRMTAVVGEKPEVAFETRKRNAKSFNDFAMVYVGNGFETNAGIVTGAKAAGRVLGMMVSSSYKSSLTKKTIDGAVSIAGELTSNEYNEAVENGMLVFSLNPDDIPQIDYGINTLVSLGEDDDEGWKKIRRVRTRYELIDRIAFTLAKAMANGIDNSHDGRQQVITLANGIINDMIMEGGLESGEMIIDPVTAPQGDSAWFKFDNLVDLDGLEKAYLAFGFKY